VLYAICSTFPATNGHLTARPRWPTFPHPIIRHLQYTQHRPYLLPGCHPRTVRYNLVGYRFSLQILDSYINPQKPAKKGSRIAQSTIPLSLVQTLPSPPTDCSILAPRSRTLSRAAVPTRARQSPLFFSASLFSVCSGFAYQSTA